VARQALTFSQRAPYARVALVDGAAGIVVAPHQRVAIVMTFITAGARIVAVDVIADPNRIGQLDLRALDAVPDERAPARDDRTGRD
jgi:RNA polymerase sigma-70 factor (ECF subfamily)